MKFLDFLPFDEVSDLRNGEEMWENKNSGLFGYFSQNMSYVLDVPAKSVQRKGSHSSISSPLPTRPAMKQPGSESLCLRY